MIYLAVFLAALATDLLPVIGPPVWTVMVFMLVKYDLNPWLVLAVGVPASVLGRFGLSLYSARFFGRFLKQKKSEEMAWAGKKLNGSLWRAWSFVLLYSLLPLSTTALFSAAGIARIKPVQILPPFFVGKFVSDAVMLFTSRVAIRNSTDLVEGTLSWQGIATAVFGLVIIAAFLFLDWRVLLERKQVRLTFHIWK